MNTPNDETNSTELKVSFISLYLSIYRAIYWRRCRLINWEYGLQVEYTAMTMLPNTNMKTLHLIYPHLETLPILTGLNMDQYSGVRRGLFDNSTTFPREVFFILDLLWLWHIYV
jgi:hypothetical protein